LLKRVARHADPAEREKHLLYLMADESLQSLIGHNHRRVISVRLRLLEEYSLQLLELFEPLEAELTSRDPLPQEMSQKMESEITALRSRIRAMKAELGLEHSERSARREAAALVSTMITYVEELHPRYLKGYGSLPEPISHYLKDRLKGLVETLNKISRALRDG
jgi:hypothetical protein